MTDAALIRRLEAAAARLFPSRGVLAAYAFGSRVSGRPRPVSDLDVGYYLDRAATRLEPLVEEMLGAALEDEVGVPIDLRDLGEASIEFRGRVLEEGVRVYSGDPARRVALERRILSSYHDYKREFEIMHQTRLRVAAARGL